MSAIQNLKQDYKDNISPKLFKQFGYTNPHQVPKLVKIKLNRGLGIDAQNKNILKKSVDEFRAITGQQPIVTQSTKSIAGFKVREKMDLGVTVTLRGSKMYYFLEKLINLVLPQIRDFRGISSKGFDRYGNFNFGLTDQLIFPEINYDSVDQIRGLNITIVTTAKTREEGEALLQEFGFPFTKN